MALESGKRLGPYEVLSPLGTGGMGEVYRARDTKLGREVAIKVLPEELSTNPERVARFEREAKLLASLNHPNIAGIYGFETQDGVNAIVLELIEGPTLAERIEQGPIPVDEAIAIAKQIAEALEAGHEAGVIHRDLKPANIKLRVDGTVKVLDYGLAKALENEAPSAVDSELSQSPTLTRQGTQIGVILGTAAYMSPEQAKGKRVEKRTDIWAFGAVLYEMLTGQRAFKGEDVSEVLASVIKSEPDWGALPRSTPDSLRSVLRLCLTKDVKGRFRDIGDAQLAISAFETTAAAGATEASVGGWHHWPIAAAAALALSIVTGIAVYRMTRPTNAPSPVVRFTLPFPESDALTYTRRHVLAVSPDGSRLVYAANQKLYLRSLDEIAPAPIEGTDGANSPVFSPDGEWVVFVADGQLKKVALSGGAPVTLSSGGGVAARWESNDTIVFRAQNGIMAVSGDGGTPEILYPKTEGVRSPQVLPDGDTVLFSLVNSTNDDDDDQIVVHSIGSKDRKVLIEGGRDAVYLPTGHLVYFFDGTLFAVRFELDELEVTGVPVSVAERVFRNQGLGGTAQFRVSDSGALVYLTGSRLESRTLVWVDRDGRERPLPAEPRAYTYPRISPDGSRVAIDVRDQEDDIWMWDFARETLTRFTFTPEHEQYPAWTLDGQRLAFASDRDLRPSMYWKAADGTGRVERLKEGENWQFPYAFTSDGSLLFLDQTGRDHDVAVLSPDGSAKGLLNSEFVERNAELSPDGRWLAYQSNVSGQHEVYVRPFPNVDGGQWLISRGGGTQPLWAPDGSEIFYLAPGARMMAVAVETARGFHTGQAQELFAGYVAGSFGRNYDISPDGERFLMVKDDAQGDSLELVVVLNWFEELKRLVPMN